MHDCIVVTQPAGTDPSALWQMALNLSTPMAEARTLESTAGLSWGTAESYFFLKSHSSKTKAIPTANLLPQTSANRWILLRHFDLETFKWPKYKVLYNLVQRLREYSHPVHPQRKGREKSCNTNWCIWKKWGSSRARKPSIRGVCQGDGWLFFQAFCMGFSLG